MSKPLVFRTPDHCFDDLPEFPFAPHYAEVKDPDFGSLRMHYLDEGKAFRGTVLMLHGEPSWSFLYRKLVGPVAEAGWRAVAPDHIGFGRSDKPALREIFSGDRFVGWIRQLVEQLDLQDVVLVCQDWGGPIGLRLLSEMPERFAGVFATNTLLPNAQPPPQGVDDWPGPIILPWIALCRDSDDLAVSEVIAASCLSRPPDSVLAAYDAPFPDPSFKAAVLAITALIPVDSEAPGITANLKAWAVLDQWQKPFATAFSDNDPTTQPWERVFRQRVPGAATAPHARITGAGHFVQEEQGEQLADALIAFLKSLNSA